MVKVVRTDDGEEVDIKKAIVVTPVAKPISPSPPPRPQVKKVNELDAIADMSDSDYEKRFKRMLRLKELEALGVRRERTTSSEPAEKRKAGSEVVQLANTLKEEYTALNEASEILNKFSKPNLGEQFMNSEMGKGLGQAIGTAAMGAIEQFALKQADKRMMAAQRQAQQPPMLPPETPPQQPPRFITVQQPQPQYDNPPPMPPQYQQQPQMPPDMPPPMPPSPASQPPQMKLRLDENDKKMLEDLQKNQQTMLQIAQTLSSVVQKVEELEKRSSATNIPPAHEPKEGIVLERKPKQPEEDKEIEDLFNETVGKEEIKDDDIKEPKEPKEHEEPEEEEAENDGIDEVN